tara:strand:- start:1009 stop:1440 length:432 start_codon:yes stop_codon:yes gene_type:complete
MSGAECPDDVVLAKAQSIQRCVSRAREELTAAGRGFATDYTRQDAAILNVTRACEQAIDLANHLVRIRHYGVPTSSADSFRLLASAGMIDADLAERLRRMVGFRNTAVHQYEEKDLDIAHRVITDGLEDILSFSHVAVRLPGE